MSEGLMPVALWILTFIVGILYLFVGLSLVAWMSEKVARVSGNEWDKFSTIASDEPFFAYIMIAAWPVVLICQLVVITCLLVGNRLPYPGLLVRWARRMEGRSRPGK